MKPIQTPHTNITFKLSGGTDENDLPAERTSSDFGPAIRTTWQPTEDERRRIIEGFPIELIVWGEGHPPVALVVAEQ